MADVDSDSDDSDLEDQPKKLNKSFSSQKSQCRNTENIEIVVDRMIAPSDQPNSISRDDNAILPPPVIQLEDYQSSSAVPAIKIDQGIPTSLHQNILIHTSSEASLIHQKDRNNVTIGRLDQVHLSTIKMNDQSPSSARNSPKLSPKTTPILKHRDRPLSQGNLKISTNVADQSNVLQQQLQQQPQQQPFSWYNDGEDSIKSKSRRSTCCGQCVLFYDSWPLFFKSIFKSSIGVILFMTPGLFSYYLFIPDKCRSSVFTNRCHEATIMMLGPYPFFVHAVIYKEIVKKQTMISLFYFKRLSGQSSGVRGLAWHFVWKFFQRCF